MLNAPLIVKCDKHPDLLYFEDIMSDPSSRLRTARERAGYRTAERAAEAMGVPKATYTQHENGLRGYPAKRASQYAKFFRTTADYLLFGVGKEPPQSSEPMLDKLSKIRNVPVMGSVQAGLWTEMKHDAEVSEYIPIALPGFERAQLFAFRVSGKSMNMHYADGSLVVVCPAAEIGIREGDHVMVRQKRFGLYESTLKEIVQKDGRIELWPRSTDSAHQTPILLPAREELSDEGPEIIGVVVAAYQTRPALNRPLINL